MHGAKHPAALRRIVDADSQILMYWLGFGLMREGRARLANLNAAEIHGVKTGSSEFKTGEKQKLFVREWFHIAEKSFKGPWPLLVDVVGPDKYGRDLCLIYRQSDMRCLNDDLIEHWPKIAV